MEIQSPEEFINCGHEVGDSYLLSDYKKTGLITKKEDQMNLFELGGINFTMNSRHRGLYCAFVLYVKTNRAEIFKYCLKRES